MNIKAQIKKEFKHSKLQNKKIFYIKHKQNEKAKSKLITITAF